LARHDRCTVCDYSEAQGSGIKGTNPGSQGRVRRYGDDLLCDECSQSIQSAIYVPPAADDGEVEHVPEDE
jgi:rubredoxin